MSQEGESIPRVDGRVGREVFARQIRTALGSDLENVPTFEEMRASFGDRLTQSLYKQQLAAARGGSKAREGRQQPKARRTPDTNRPTPLSKLSDPTEPGQNDDPDTYNRRVIGEAVATGAYSIPELADRLGITTKEVRDYIRNL